MFNKAFFVVALYIAGIVAQTVDVQFYDEESCDNVGATCNALPPNDCCGDLDILWTSISTDNWVDVAEGTEVRVHTQQNNNLCGILLVDIEEGECLINEVPDTISAAAFIDGETRKRRRGTPAAPVAKREECANTHPIDEFFYQPGDGFRYIVSAQNTTHVAAFKAASTSAERAKYISANFEKKVAVKALTKKTTGSFTSK